MRAVSTVLDASLCLLLVSASVLTLAGTPLDREAGQGSRPQTTRVGPDTADELAAVLATSTARVTYRAGGRTRTVHDTLAGLLAAAVATDTGSAATASGAGRGTDVAETEHDSGAFRRAAVERVTRTLRRYRARGVGTQVVASAAGDARVVAGAEPPPGADVYAAAFEVRGVALTVRTWSR